MHISRLVFKLSDVINTIPRNYKRYGNVTTIKNISYSSVAKEKRFNTADVYFDKSRTAEKLPVFINIHGGGFVGGDKKHRAGICRLVASKGWFVYNINFRLYHKYPAPHATRDCVDAVNYLTKLSERFNIDLDNVVISGDSAGAYSAAHVLAARYDESVRSAFDLPECKINFKAGALFCGLYDFNLCLKAKSSIADDIGGCILGVKPDKEKKYVSDYKLMKELSPINAVNIKWPELFLSKAHKDAFCGGQTELLEKKLLEVGVKFIAQTLSEIHCSHLFPFKESSKRCYKELFKFLDGIKALTVKETEPETAPIAETIAIIEAAATIDAVTLEEPIAISETAVTETIITPETETIAETVSAEATSADNSDIMQ